MIHYPKVNALPDEIKRHINLAKKSIRSAKILSEEKEYRHAVS